MRRRILLALALLTLLTAVGTELGLPPLAESRVRNQLDTFGHVTDVQVTATPAVKLLAGQVDKAMVRMSSATLDTTTLDPQLLTKAEGAEAVQARIGTLHAGPVDLDSVLIDKTGDTLDASAHVDIAQIERLLPGADLKVNHRRLLLELRQLPIPLPGPLQLQIAVEDGSVVARPLGSAAGLLPPQTLLDRPEIDVTALNSRLADGDLTLQATATLNQAS